jgi:hypothetical protein
MIPEFPNFKHLEISDKTDIELHTKKFPPYSDFNFVSMWSWDIKNEMLLSLLNGNLVVRFTDYVDGTPFYSFLGENNLDETAETLIDFAKKEGLKGELKLVPEDVAKHLSKNKFESKEDRDHHDYIILTSTLKDYNTPKTHSRRKSVKRMLADFTPEIRLLNIDELGHQKNILRLITDRVKTDKNVFENEILAISRFMSNHKEISFLPMGIFINNELAGFFFSEVLNDGYATAHFWKANTKISQHIYAYLMQEKAKMLHERGCKFMNIEQDLGQENLRKWKSSYSSEIFLKKYIITKK